MRLKHKDSEHLQLIRDNSHLSIKQLCELTGLTSFTIINIKNSYGIRKTYSLSNEQREQVKSLVNLLSPKEIAEKLNLPRRPTYLFIYHKLGKRYLIRKTK